jgi:dolichol-phosphate mannosyltransferase
MTDISISAMGDRESSGRGYSPPELAIVVPTYNEAANVAELGRLLDAALKGVTWEVIFVDDDSPDRTHEVVRRIALSDPRVRFLRRVGRRGLSTACIEGMLSTPANAIAVIDGDLQHDEKILPLMLERLRRDMLDIVVGSRYVSGGSLGGWNKIRIAISQFATKATKMLIGTELMDPMSGFFMLRREVIDETAKDLSGAGFKILLDLLASSNRPLRCTEVPYIFRARAAGESKLDSRVAIEFAMLLLEKTVGRYVPVRFLVFSAVGFVGLIFHLIVLTLTYKVFGLAFALSQTLATLAAMTFNFFVNNILTYRDQRLTGWAVLKGWFSFCLACSIGAIANVGVAVYANDSFRASISLAWLWSAVFGVAVGAVWNYGVTAFYTWGRKA